MIRRLFCLLLVVLTVPACRPPSANVTVAVFFMRSEGNALMLADNTRTVPRGGPEELIHAALTALLEGPTQDEQARGMTTAIPAGTRLRSVEVTDGVAQADFSRELASGGGSASMLGRLWQIVYTATQFREAPRVQILIDGERREALGGEGVIIGEPIARPSAPPRF